MKNRSAFFIISASVLYFAFTTAARGDEFFPQDKQLKVHTDSSNLRRQLDICLTTNKLDGELATVESQTILNQIAENPESTPLEDRNENIMRGEVESANRLSKTAIVVSLKSTNASSGILQLLYRKSNLKSSGKVSDTLTIAYKFFAINDSCKLMGTVTERIHKGFIGSRNLETDGLFGEPTMVKNYFDIYFQ